MTTVFTSPALARTPLPARVMQGGGQQQGGQNGQQPVSGRLGVQVEVTAQGVAVTWRALLGASRYVVHRSQRLANESRCCQLHVQVGTALRYVDAPLPPAGTYVYRVVAHLQGGRRESQERVVPIAGPPTATAQPATPPADPAGTPTGVATLVDPNRPRDLARRMPPGGSAPAQTDQAGAGNSPATQQVVPLQAAMPEPSSQPAATGGTSAQSSGGALPAEPPDRNRRLTLAVPPPAGGGSQPVPGASSPAASGGYLLTVTGLRAGTVTTDNMLHEDGKGDEVFAAAYIRRYDRRTATLVESATRQTMVYGDVLKRLNERVQAGRLSPMGGIADGDPIPADASVARSLPAQDNVFPWKLWQGTLTDGVDAIVISPSIWEWDGRPPLFHGWTANQAALNNTLFLSQRLQDQIMSRTFGPLQLSVTDVINPRQVENNLTALVPYAFGIPVTLNEGEDRPIGLTGGPSLPNTAVVLTREIIEAALARPAQGVANPVPNVLIPLTTPGLMVINFEDRWRRSFTDRLAFYSMILQVERAP